MSHAQHSFAVAMCTDVNYASAAAVTIASLGEHRPAGRDLEIWFLHTGLDDAQLHLIRAAASLSGAHLHVCPIAEQRLAIPIRSDYITSATAGRFFLGDVLPSRIQRVLYLDCDLFVTGDLTDLWETDLSASPVAAVHEATTAVTGVPKTYEHPLDPHLDPNAPYFNAGVLLIDLAAWRAQEVGRKAAAYTHEKRPPLMDQDALNAVLTDQWQQLDRQWNVTTFWFRSRSRQERYQSLLRRARVVHYVGHRKPWLRDDVWMAGQWRAHRDRVQRAASEKRAPEM